MTTITAGTYDRDEVLTVAAGMDERTVSARRSRMRSLAVLALWGLVAFAALVSIMMLWWPLGYDQGVFASNGAVVANGGVPYRDAWDLKGPLTFYVMAALQMLFGSNAWGVRVVDVGLALLTAWLLRRRLLPLTGAAAALAGAASWPIFVAWMTYDESAQFDMWVGVAMLGSTFMVARQDGYRTRDLVIAGVLIGLASLVKPFYAGFLVVPGVVILMQRRGAARASARDVGALVLGWAAPVAAALALLWWQGALRDTLDVYILYSLRVYATDTSWARYPSTSPIWVRIQGLTTYLTTMAALIAPMIAGVVVLWRRRRVLAVAMSSWLVIGVGLVVLQGKFWPYHWSIIYPAVPFLVVLALHAVLTGARCVGGTFNAAATSLAVATLVVLAGMFSFGPLMDLALWTQYVTGGRSRAAYEATFDKYGEIDQTAERVVASYIRSHTRPGEPFALWSLDAALPFLADRPNVSRFQNKRELIITRASPLTQAYRRELLASVRSRRPTHVVVGRRGDLMKPPGTSPEVLQREFPELGALIAQRYVLEASFRLTDVYRLRAATDPATAAAVPR